MSVLSKFTRKIKKDKALNIEIRKVINRGARKIIRSKFGPLMAHADRVLK